MLIYGNESERPAPGTPEQQAIMKEYFAYGDMVVERGAFKSGDALMPSGTATTVRVNDGKTLTTDGPFAETKEQLGGFYILDCKDLDEAIEWASKIPTAVSGCVEVRPVIQYD